MQPIIELNQVYKDYPQAGGRQTVLHGIDLRIAAGEFVAIVGPSGNGKSTLLNLIAGIDHPSRGEIVVAGHALQNLGNERLARWRGEHVGIVFQFFQLLPALSLLQNVILPMDFLGRLPKRQRRERALQLLDSVGLLGAADRLPSQVSGGQQQRAAIARALANDPPLIVADEPTGNLDSASADSVFDLFSHLRDRGKTLLMVTHNEALADAASRKLEIRGGRLHADSHREPR
ncbi:ABC transporter ATP-binding protein [Methylomonas koyamae]|uniref:ABC transporter ATP-binding protein n=2 Tax=Methylomonas koyamae TaxID=702114 RepID=A0A291IMT3_9GAMM|nr:ABC transporter ATP-binding protein [Methylomonas koyamae]ATG91477.1 putative ABC transport system ATP-binding protein [Methylomonas koyamae]OAI26867.1 ABC transporter ATP-binding protein [Methylomonas koyamae]WNB74953.1 ABC transporter ATP-binding protein [Methylomonas koyamae]BBL59674.1 ABC transporter ATP-binding protein [Methylomonas koyamae]